MDKALHSEHKAIADIFENVLSSDDGLQSNYRLIRDEACGGNQRIPLFYVTEKSRATEYCNVDLLVLKDNRIRMIVEIEESDVKPTQICGKLLTSALASYYIHSSRNNEPVEMGESVTFIQIVDTSKLVEDRTSKFDQWKALEKSIQNILPLKNSRINEYRLFNIEELADLTSFLKKIV